MYHRAVETVRSFLTWDAFFGVQWSGVFSVDLREAHFLLRTVIQALTPLGKSQARQAGLGETDLVWLSIRAVRGSAATLQVFGDEKGKLLSRLGVPDAPSQSRWFRSAAEKLGFSHKGASPGDDERLSIVREIFKTNSGERHKTDYGSETWISLPVETAEGDKPSVVQLLEEVIGREQSEYIRKLFDGFTNVDLIQNQKNSQYYLYIKVNNGNHLKFLLVEFYAEDPEPKLQDQDWIVRRDALEEIDRKSHPRAFELFSSAVDDAAPEVRRMAVIGLVHLGEWGDKKRAMDAILPAFEDREPEVRRTAAEAAFCLRDIRAAEPLKNLLRDTDSEVRRVAENALLNTIPAKAAGELIDQARAEVSSLAEAETIPGRMLVSSSELSAICIGFVNLSPTEKEAFNLALHLLERWNPELYPSIPPSAKIRAFQASSLDGLAQILRELTDRDYSGCSAILQTGKFDVARQSTGAQSQVEVILATYWQSEVERKIIIAPGAELSLMPS